MYRWGPETVKKSNRVLEKPDSNVKFAIYRIDLISAMYKKEFEHVNCFQSNVLPVFMFKRLFCVLSILSTKYAPALLLAYQFYYAKWNVHFQLHCCYF